MGYGGNRKVPFVSCVGQCRNVPRTLRNLSRFASVLFLYAAYGLGHWASAEQVTISTSGSLRTNTDSVSFQISVAPGLTVEHSAIALTGDLAEAAEFAQTGGSPDYQVHVTPFDPVAEGTLGIVVGVELPESGYMEFESPLYILDNTPPAMVVGEPTASEPNASPTDNGPIQFPVAFLPEPGEAMTIHLSNSLVEFLPTGTVAADLEVEILNDLEARISVKNLIGDGTFQLEIVAGAAVDEAGNATGPVSTEVVDVDNSPFLVTIGQPSVDATRNGPVEYTVSYLGAATVNLAADHISLVTADNIQASFRVSGEGTRERTVTVEAIEGDGSFAIAILSGSARDAQGFSAPAAGPSEYVQVDSSQPVVELGGPTIALTNVGPVEYTVTFDEGDTVHLNESHVEVEGEGTAEADVNVSGTALERRVHLENIRGDGSLRIRILEGAASDATGGESAATEWTTTVIVDNTAPAVTLNQHSGQADPADRLPLTFDVRFSEPVEGFDASDILSEGSATGVAVSINGEATAFRVFVTGISEAGDVRLSIPAGTAQDAAGNGNLASTSDDNEVLYAPNVSPPCELTSITMLSPVDGARVAIGPGRFPAALHFAAETDCAAETLLVEYAIGNLQLGTSDTPPYHVSVDDALTELEPGEHEIVATAVHRGSGRVVTESLSAFTLVRAGSLEDGNRDGLPDDPAASIPNEGDQWLSSTKSESSSSLRTISARRVVLAERAMDSIFIAASDPDATFSRASATLTSEAFEPDAEGLLILAMAEDPETLLGENALDVLGREPIPGLVPGGRYVDLGFISMPGEGDDPVKGLSSYPVRFVLEGMPVVSGGPESVYVHPSVVEWLDDAIKLSPAPGEWTQLDVAEQTILDGRIEAHLMSLALVAPFNGPEARAAVLDVRPSSIHFGDIPMGANAEADLIVANDGGSLLEGEIAVGAPFEIVSGAEYAIAPGKSHTIRLRFQPRSQESFVVVAQLSGAQGRSVTLRGSSSGIAILGCAAGSGTPSCALPDLSGDIALVLLTLIAVMFARLAPAITSKR